MKPTDFVSPKLKFISLFAGIGGFDLALTRQGHECVWANEWDKYAAQIYDKNFKTKIDQRDIRDVDEKDLPESDLLVGGFPCQAFSIAGKRRGFDDTRGTLFFEIARILRAKQPRLFILENVKGLLSHDDGNTFKTIIATLDELGYDLQWQVLNSKNFGVPQNRERVFIVGHLRGTSRPQVFPVGEIYGISSKKNISKEGRTQTKLSSPLRANPAKKADDTFIIHNIYGGFNEKNVRQFRDISPTIRTPKGGGHIPMVASDIISKDLYDKIKELAGKEQTPEEFDFMSDYCDEDGYLLPYLTDEYGDLLPWKLTIRKLTPTECERLQGFPDGWTEGISDTQRYKCLGNAVTVNVVSYLVSKL